MILKLSQRVFSLSITTTLIHICFKAKIQIYTIQKHYVISSQICGNYGVLYWHYLLNQHFHEQVIVIGNGSLKSLQNIVGSLLNAFLPRRVFICVMSIRSSVSMFQCYFEKKSFLSSLSHLVCLETIELFGSTVLIQHFSKSQTYDDCQVNMNNSF